MIRNRNFGVSNPALQVVCQSCRTAVVWLGTVAPPVPPSHCLVQWHRANAAGHTGSLSTRLRVVNFSASDLLGLRLGNQSGWHSDEPAASGMPGHQQPDRV